MRPREEALSRRLVACPSWPSWVMEPHGARRIVVDGETMYRTEEHGIRMVLRGEDWLPDLRDPATRGVVLDVVRTVAQQPRAALVPSEFFWYLGHRPCLAQAGTEEEALVIALESLPETP